MTGSVVDSPGPTSAGETVFEEAKEVGSREMGGKTRGELGEGERLEDRRGEEAVEDLRDTAVAGATDAVAAIQSFDRTLMTEAGAREKDRAKTP